MHESHFRDMFGLIFLAVTNAFTVNREKLLICITDKGDETFFLTEICNHQLFQGNI